MDPVTEATAEAQRRAEARLKSPSAKATVPGLPPPADPTWLEAQLKEVNKPAAPQPGTAPTTPNSALLRPRSYSTRQLPIQRRDRSYSKQLDSSVGVEDWQAVYKAYGKTGDENLIAAETNLTREQVDYLLDFGARRLHLPAIRDHACNDATVQLELEKGARDLTAASNMELDIPEVQRAVTKRVVQEAVVAQKGLEAASAVGKLMDAWVNKLLKLVEQDAFVVGTQVTPESIEKLVRTLEAHTRTTEKAIKTYRLSRGEPTEVIAHQVGVLLADCTPEELELADLSGDIPARILGRFVTPDSTILDADFEEMKDSEDSEEKE